MFKVIVELCWSDGLLDGRRKRIYIVLEIAVMSSSILFGASIEVVFVSHTM